MAESSSAPPTADKPVIVRVKRKVSQFALDAFWLEIHERPAKRPLIDFGKLSISDASSSKVEEFKTQKILVRHVETVASSKDTFDVLRSFVPNSSDKLESEEKIEKRKRSFKTVDKEGQRLVNARQSQEVLSRNARFEQIWRSRKLQKDNPGDDAIYDMCRLYDVVRIDVEEHAVKEHIVEVKKQKEVDIDEYKIMGDFLPLLREVLPTAAEEIEHDIHDLVSKQDGYVYDVYTIEEDVNELDADYASQIPKIEVDDDEDIYDGPDVTEYESDDSNDENNPLNDYPDEEEDEEEEEEEEEEESRSSDEESEGESTTSGSQSDDPKGGSEVSYGLSDMGSEEYDWLDYADENLEDEESYCFYLINHDLMGENSSIPFEHFRLSVDSEIPFDLFVSKKYKGLGLRGFVRYADSTGNSVYTVEKSSAASDRDCVKQLLDSSGNILFSIRRVHDHGVDIRETVKAR
ncbi:RNA-directed DNA methylation 4-like isoform X3 [Salvia splendens]|uniref:RNA-directed DNA methylation 4-like isoform X3 n=1 Tax=Salvia splendens TaxID=180675 RepID=UPI001C2651DA|nr:RNA-directed DNA methylation 4-like isoform X3 [Salvia splendens]